MPTAKITYETIKHPERLLRLCRLLSETLTETDTLATELKVDVDLLNTLTTELRADHPTFKAAVDANKVAMEAHCFGAGGLAAMAASSATKMKMAVGVNYAIGKYVYAKAAFSSIAFTASSHDISASASAAQAAPYLLTLDASGSETVTMGSIQVASSSSAGNKVATAMAAALAALPDTPASEAPVAVLILGLAKTKTFNATTTKLNSSNTDSYHSLAYHTVIPAGPAAISAPAVGSAIAASSITQRLEGGIDW